MDNGITTSDVAIWLAIYASIVSTAAGLWALFSGVFRDRARISVRAADVYLVSTAKGTNLLVKAEDTLQMMGVGPHQRREVLRILVRNRGRRDAKIEALGRVTLTGSLMFADLSSELPFDLPAESSETLVVGTAAGGHSFGDVPLRRFYVEDGAGRVHPLRERWRLRLETVLYRWAVHLYWNRRRRQMRARGEPK